MYRVIDHTGNPESGVNGDLEAQKKVCDSLNEQYRAGGKQTRFFYIERLTLVYGPPQVNAAVPAPKNIVAPAPVSDPASDPSGLLQLTQ